MAKRARNYCRPAFATVQAKDLKVHGPRCCTDLHHFEGLGIENELRCYTSLPDPDMHINLPPPGNE